jgi:hypothetical protein
MKIPQFGPPEIPLMPRKQAHAAPSSSLRHRILRARKTGREREFELMLAWRPERVSVVAEGDSWFAYPPPNLVGIDNRSNIINWLTRSLELNLLQLASNGDEAVQMLSGPSKHRLIAVLRRFAVDFLLFSGGGNDLVGRNDFEYLLRDGTRIDSDDVRDYLHTERVDRRLALVEMAYRELIDYCGEYSRNPQLRIITHCYDYATPGKRGAVFAGGLIRADGGRSWMYPALLAKNIPPRLHPHVVRHVIDGLAGRLLGLQQEFPGRFNVIDTRGLLGPEYWVNEIHPDRAGFGLISAALVARLRTLDPRL